MRFWLKRGVDGFRVDAVPFLAEDVELRDEPVKPACQEVNSRKCLVHVYTENQPKTYEVIRAFSDMLQEEYKGEK